MNLYRDLSRMVAVVLSLTLLIHESSAHEGILPHSHVADGHGVSLLVLSLVITAVIAAIVGWRLFKHR